MTFLIAFYTSNDVFEREIKYKRKNVKQQHGRCTKEKNNTNYKQVGMCNLQTFDFGKS